MKLMPGFSDILPPTCTDILADPPTKPPRVYSFKTDPMLQLFTSKWKITGLAWLTGGRAGLNDENNWLADKKVLPDLKRMYVGFFLGSHRCSIADEIVADNTQFTAILKARNLTQLCVMHGT
jgi:hypothetical protein